MVLVDTSVWIRLHRERDHPIGQLLWQLAARDEAAVCGAIWVEFIGGFRNPARRITNANRLAAFQWLDTDRQAYELAAEFRQSDASLGTVDLIIAATAAVHRVPLLTLDGGFAPLAAHGLELISLPGSSSA